MNERREHLPEIDWLKGFAILAVIGIHAKPYADSFLFLQVVNRGVHTFLVLFGISAELWWRRESTRAPRETLRSWYAGRLSRVVPGYWAMTAIWWLVVTFWQHPPGNLQLGGLQALVSFTGFAPWIGTSWFVAIILQYILLFPALRWLSARVPAALLLAVSAAASFASCWFILHIVTAGKAWFGDNVPFPGWYYQWVFAPRVLWDVVAGIYVARFWGGRISQRATAGAFVLTAIGIALTYVAKNAVNDNLGPVREMAVAHIVDVPLSLFLLGVFRWVPLPGMVQRFLRFCGLYSWGIYLGHLLVHEVVMIAGYQPFMASNGVRLGYALGLLASGIALAVLASRIERTLRSRVSPAPA